MAKTPENHRKPWSASDIRHLKKLVSENTPTRVIALKLGRMTAAIYGKASDLNISLKPVNQSPYNRRKKR